MQHKITVNEKEYHSVDEMPPEIRTAYQQAMAALADSGSSSSRDVAPDSVRTSVTVKERFVVNGREDSSLDEVPPEVRSAIEAAMAKNGPSDALADPQATYVDPAGYTAKELERRLVSSSGVSPSASGAAPRLLLWVLAVLGGILIILGLLEVAGRI